MNEEMVRQRRIREANEAEAARAVVPPNASVLKLQNRIGQMQQQLNADLTPAERRVIEQAIAKDEGTLRDIQVALDEQRGIIASRREDDALLRETELNKREEALNERAAQLDSLADAIAKREAACDKREQEIAAREAVG